MRSLLLSLSLTMLLLGVLKGQNLENCFNGTLEFNHQSCSIIHEPIITQCGVNRYYLPPIWEIVGLNAPTNLFISTAFDNANVRIYSSDGLNGTPSFEDNFNISKTTPRNYSLTLNGRVNFKEQTTNYNQVETGKGLIIESDRPLTIVYRLTNTINQSFFVLKGQEGLGYGFYGASQTDVEVPASASEAHFISVMAIEDNTRLKFTKNGYSIEGRDNSSSNSNDIDLTNGHEVTLNAGQTYLIRDNVSSSNSIAGILVTSDKPVTVVSGSHHSKHQSGFNDRDAGIDQLIPLNKLTNEYVAVRGTNNQNIDYLIIIGIHDNTNINANNQNIGNINAGQILEHRLAGIGGETFFISSDKPIAVYHVSGLFDEEVGMSQLPPLIACNGNKRVNYSLIGSNQQKLNIIISNAGLSTLRINNSPFTSLSSARVITGTLYSVVSIDENQLNQNDNVIESDELFQIGVISGDALGGSYGYVTKYGDEIALFEKDSSKFLNNLVEKKLTITESNTGVNFELDAYSCAPPVVIESINGNFSAFNTPNGAGVTFNDLEFSYRTLNSSTFTEELNIIARDQNGRKGSICYKIQVLSNEICGNNIDDDQDGQIDEIDECPVNPCSVNCNSTGCRPIISEVVTESPTCNNLTSGGIGILSPSANLEFSINGGISFSSTSSFFNLTSGSYNILVRNRETLCSASWPNNPVVLQDPNCNTCTAYAGIPAGSKEYCSIGTKFSISPWRNVNMKIPAGYETVYILTSEPDLTILDFGINNSIFYVEDIENYRIHTLIAETTDINSPNFLNLSFINKGFTTLVQLNQVILGRNVCSSLDIEGHLIKVIDASHPNCQKSENTIRLCTDNIDNDGDGLVDCIDPECQGFMLCMENNFANCIDGTDNDNDGLVDCEDPECKSFIACEEEGDQCSDGIDNDQDGLIDCAEKNCANDPKCNENSLVACCDGIDNDGDGLTDCVDSGCYQFLFCREHTLATCTDGIDNDLDGLIDCEDKNCQALGLAVCQASTTNTSCFDILEVPENQKKCHDENCNLLPECDLDSDGVIDSEDKDPTDPCIPFYTEDCDDSYNTGQHAFRSYLLKFEIKLFLEGPYNANKGKMNTTLNNLGYLPGQNPSTLFGHKTDSVNPYSGAPWNQDNSDINGIVEQNQSEWKYPANAIDWVLLSLRNTDKKEIVLSTTGLLLEDGRVIFNTYVNPESLEQKEFYITIEHRNHLPAMSKFSVPVINGKIEYDFTLADSFTSFGAGQSRLSDLTYGLISGNAEIHTKLNSYVDINTFDLSKLKKSIGINSGYFNDDLDMNGDINVQDISLFLKNNGQFSSVKFNK